MTAVGDKPEHRCGKPERDQISAGRPEQRRETRAAVSESASLDEVYRAHADVVYRTLARVGVAESDRADQLQEVFVVVHRQLPRYRPDAKITTWLYAIARRVAAGYRRKAFRRHEENRPLPHAGAVADDCPEQNTERSQAAARVEGSLKSMTRDQRAVFIMFEIDEMTGQEIADLLGCPLQTVFSRLRRARTQFERQVERLKKIEERRQP